MIIEALLSAAVSGTPAPTDDYWYTNYPVRPGEADVSPNGALQVTAVMACVRVLAETVAQLPLHLMAENGRMRQRAIEHPLYDVLHDQPNGWQTSFEFREMMEAHLVLRGNAYAQIKPGPRGAVDELLPLHPDRMQVFRLKSGRIGYLYRDQQGEEYRLTQDEVFHLRGMSLNDCVGISVIAACRNAVELAQQLDRHGIWFYRNSARPSGVIKMPEGFYFDDEDHAKRMGKSWRDAHSGQDLFTVAFLEGGAEWQQLGLSNEDAQWLESKRKSVTEIAMMFRVPPHMIGSAIEHGQTYANVEHSGLAFMKHTMLPWLRRWEGAIRRDLIVQPAGSTERLYAKFAVDGLLRADTKTRALFYETMVRNRLMLRNEVRALEDMNPVKGGDEFDEVSQPAVVPAPKGGAVAAETGLLLSAIEAGTADTRVTVLKDGGKIRDCLLATEGNIATGVGQQGEVILRAASAHFADAETHRGKLAADVRTTVDEDGEHTRTTIGVASQYLSEGQCRDTASLATISEKHRDEVKQAVLDGNAATAQPAAQDAARDAWITDTAERIAAAEIALLEKRADKAAEDRAKFDAWAKRYWGGKGQSYMAGPMAPILSACGVEKDAQVVAAGLCEMAVSQLTTDDPVEVLARWQGGDRAEEIAKHLTEAVNDG